MSLVPTQEYDGINGYFDIGIEVQLQKLTIQLKEVPTHELRKGLRKRGWFSNQVCEASVAPQALI